MMRSRPTLLRRIAAFLRGEVSAAVLEAYQRASLLVHELMDDVERRRLQHAVAGLDAWALAAAARAEMVCAWNAFALQSLGDALVEADYQESPATAGFVPRATAEQALRFYGPVEGWLNLAHQARANPAFSLDGVPAPLPEWGAGAPLPRAQLRGLLAVMRSLEGHASAAVELLSRPEPRDAAARQQLARILQLYASALATARYAEELCGAAPVDAVQLRAEPRVKRAIEQLFHVGQLAADPHLSVAALPPPFHDEPPEPVVPTDPSPASARRSRLGKLVPLSSRPPRPHPVPEELEHRDRPVRDRNGVEVRPNGRIKHAEWGAGTYMGIGSQGSVFMMREDGVVVSFTDRDFHRVYMIRTQTD